MTIEELLECSVDQLEKMSDAQLLEHFKPYFNVTRPELAVKPTKSAPVPVYVSPQKRKVLDLLAAEGIDVSFATKRKNSSK